MHDAEWNDYKGRRNFLVVASIGVAIGAAIIGGILDDTFGRNSVHFLFVAIPWVILCGWAVYRYMQFRCPSCGQSFFWKGWYRNHFALKCLHCGSPKWS